MSASPESRIIGMSHQHPVENQSFFKENITSYGGRIAPKEIKEMPPILRNDFSHIL
jgi:hypothetical protein